MTSPAQERIEKARLKVSQAQARLEALSARAATHERKADTRRKIILGGLLLDAANKDSRYAGILETLLRRILGLWSYALNKPGSATTRCWSIRTGTA